MSNEHDNTVEARRIGDGGFFRKRPGTYVYMRMHDDAARFLGLDAGKIHGTGGHGGTASVDKETRVVPCTVHDFMACWYPAPARVR